MQPTLQVAAASLRIQIDSLPTEIDEVERAILRAEIERQALKKEDDKHSRERLKEIERELAEREISLELTEPAREVLFREGYEPAYGARPMKRALQRLVQDPLARRILKGEILPGDTVTEDADAKTVELRFERAGNLVEV